jgi:hypothetical protein
MEDLIYQSYNNHEKLQKSIVVLIVGDSGGGITIINFNFIIIHTYAM